METTSPLAAAAGALPPDAEFPVTAWWPDHIVESAWTEHTPFAAWLIEAIRPSVFVELGVHRGASYFAFCQAAARLAPAPRCFGVDSLRGDGDTGGNEASGHDAVSAVNAARYAEFSTLLRMPISEALGHFPDGAVDLLHIKGFRGYEALAEDFRDWLPKMSARGVVLFHGTEVREPDVGAWRLRDELASRYPSFSFEHGFGLCVLATGAEPPAALAPLFGADQQATARIRETFAARGAAVQRRYLAMSAAPSPRGPSGRRPADARAGASRIHDLLAGVDRAARILEIGPSHAPIAPRSAGWDTTVVDHADRAGLVAKYANDPSVDTSRIEDVDFVWSGGALDALIPPGRHGTFDLLIASHVIEHFPDPIGVLRSAQRLLRPDTGMVSLAVPDKRTCFDFFRPPSSTGKMLAAHRDGRTRHLAADIFDQYSLMSALNGQTGWGWQNAEAVRPLHTIALAHRMFLSANESPDAPYEDSHAWIFTPASFELIILELGELGIIDWRIERMMPQAGVEFIVHLRRGRRLFPSADAFAAHRLELLRDAMRDIHAQAEAFLGISPVPTAACSGEAPAAPPVIADRHEALRLRAAAAYRSHVPLGLRRVVARLRGRIP